MSVSTNTWIVRPQPNPTARARLFCFPYAGGGASAFRTWPQYLPAGLELCALQLPGRENRLHEEPFTHTTPLVEALAKQIIPFLNKPFAFFGHSMGALISFEMARYLQRRKFNMPRLLLISAHRAPHLPYKHMKIHNASLQALEKRLRGLNGTPPEVFEQEELMTLVAPLVRADFAICETYQYEKQEPLKCPISVFGSLDDGEVNYAELCAWYTETPHPVTIRLYEGDHFYLQNKVEPFLAAVTEDLYRYLPLRF